MQNAQKNPPHTHKMYNEEILHTPRHFAPQNGAVSEGVARSESVGAKRRSGLERAHARKRGEIRPGAKRRGCA